MDTKVLSAASQKRAAQFFNVVSVMVIVFMPIFPILLVWIAGSILVYSANIYHPNPLVRDYTKFGGYRFYGLVGALLATMNYSGLLTNLLGGAINLLLTIWIVSIVIVVPFGVRAILKAGKENWQEIADGV